MISRLSSSRVSLLWVSNDTEARLISEDIDVKDILKIPMLDKLVVINQFDKTMDGPSALVLVQTKLEVHTHNGKIATLKSKDEVKGRITLGWLVEPKDALWVSEDILWAYKSSH